MGVESESWYLQSEGVYCAIHKVRGPEKVKSTLPCHPTQRFSSTWFEESLKQGCEYANPNLTSFSELLLSVLE